MEQSLLTLKFKGSIMEAIAEAKKQKKIFLVYISGDNPESYNLTTSTWGNSTLAESVLKFCILLHISEGSMDAANFSAIYPQKPPPCITAVGYNGVLLWQYDGFVAPDILASSIEKSWLSLHVQETTATYLIAALASEKEPASEISDGTLAEQGSSSRTNARSSPTDLQNNAAEVGPSANLDIVEESTYPQPTSKEEKTEPHDKALLAKSSLVNDIRNSEIMDETCSTAKAVVPANPGTEGMSKTEDEYLNMAKSANNHQFEDEKVASLNTVKADIEVCQDKNVEVEKANVLEPSACKSNDAHLSIRLPDGSSLQVKFPVTDSLRVVKDYVDENMTSSFGPYDLAVPYPRKVFGEQDLSKTLQELDLFGRQSLIVVQHRHGTSQPKVAASLHGQTNLDRGSSSNGSNDGYWGYAKRIISFLNPLSYLGGDANSPTNVQQSQNGQSRMRQNSLNPSGQGNLTGAARSLGVQSSNQSTSANIQNSNSSVRQQNRPPFGSNIHALRRDEDDSRFGDRNAFWNGNSTQFGGDSDGK